MCVSVHVAVMCQGFRKARLTIAEHVNSSEFCSLVFSVKAKTEAYLRYICNVKLEWGEPHVDKTEQNVHSS